MYVCINRRGREEGPLSIGRRLPQTFDIAVLGCEFVSKCTSCRTPVYEMSRRPPRPQRPQCYFWAGKCPQCHKISEADQNFSNSGQLARCTRTHPRRPLLNLFTAKVFSVHNWDRAEHDSVSKPYRLPCSLYYTPVRSLAIVSSNSFLPNRSNCAVLPLTLRRRHRYGRHINSTLLRFSTRL